MIKNRKLTAMLVGLHSIFVVLYIHKSSRFVQESYRMQHNETTMKQLEREKQQLLYNLNMVQSRSVIQDFARNNLGMQSITLKQVNKLFT